jgi:hypothetical protein
MKTIFILVIICLFFSELQAQISIAPSKGDRFDYFLNGDVWETSLTNKSEFVLKVFISGEYEVIWIQNLSLKESVLKQLEEYINELPGIATGGETKSSANGKENWRLESFEIWYKDTNGFIPSNQKAGNLNILYLQNKIKLYFK